MARSFHSRRFDFETHFCPSPFVVCHRAREMHMCMDHVLTCIAYEKINVLSAGIGLTDWP